MRVGQIRVFVFIHSILLRQGVELALSLKDDISILKAYDLNEALSTYNRQVPNVAIVDIDAQSDSGASVIRQLRKYWPEIGIIAMASSYSDEQLFQLLKAQAAACVPKDAKAEQLVDTVRKVAHGERPINENLITHPNLAHQIFEQFQELCCQDESRTMVAHLTPREVEILNYISKSFMNKQIAMKLGLSEQTIKNHVTSILRKLNANARTEAVDVAKRHGLLAVN